MTTGLAIAVVARRYTGVPYLAVTLATAVLLFVFWLLRPFIALCLTVMLTAVSDTSTVAWFPFVKNLSSRESIAFISDSARISPLELSLFVGVGISVVRHYARTGRPVRRTATLWPTMIFSAAIVYAFARGVSRGADLRIAWLEGRAMVYIPLMFILVTNECASARRERQLLWAILAGVFVQSLLSIAHLMQLSPSERSGLDSLNEHGSSLGQNLVFVALATVVLLMRRQGATVVVLMVVAIPTTYVYLVGQRRAGMAGLLLAGLLVAATLYWRRRRLFWKVVPAIAFVGALYVGAFWNASSSAIGFPAQAVKTVVAPTSLSEVDQASDIYRTIEAVDLNVTIRSSPLGGIGFGHPFYRPIPLPEIADFELNIYVAHNSILWVWVKAGFIGFAAMFLMFGRALLESARRARLETDPLAPLCAGAFVGMYAMFTYFDISWDPRNTVFLGAALAICGNRAAARRQQAAPARTEQPAQLSEARTAVLI